MTEDKIEQTIGDIDLSMSMEGMPLTDENKQVMREIMQGRRSLEEEIDRAVAAFMAAGKAYA